MARRTSPPTRHAIAAAMLAIPLALVGCSSGSGSTEAAEERDLGTPVAGEIAEGALAGTTIAFAGSGGILQEGHDKAIWQPFAEQSGAEVVQDAFDSGKLKAMVDSGNSQWDIVLTGSLDTAQGCGTLYEELDMSQLDTSKVPEGTILNECMVPSILYGQVLVYNEEVFGDNPPQTAADFFDTEKFPGKRGVNMSTWPSGEIIEYAYLAQGKTGDELTTADIEHGLDPYRELGDDLIGWTTGAQAQQQLESGEVVMSLVWTGRGHAAAEAGAPVAASWDDWFVLIDSLAIPKNSHDPQASHAAINYFLGADQQQRSSELTSYGPVNVDAKPQLDELGMEWLSTEYLDSGRTSNSQFWLENYDELSAAWAAFVTGV